jgi:hypothetical protein
MFTPVDAVYLVQEHFFFNKSISSALRRHNYLPQQRYMQE